MVLRSDEEKTERESSKYVGNGRTDYVPQRQRRSLAGDRDDDDCQL